MRPDELRFRDERQLKELFYRAFDRSRLEALMLLQDDRLDREAAFLGEGHHFRAWRLRAGVHGQHFSSPSPSLVLKRASRTLGEANGPLRRQWLHAMTRLKGAGGLVPPFEIVEVRDQIGLVMPYGDKTLDQAAPHWQPMDNRLEELTASLASRGLVLGDIPQGRSFGGIPFVYDLSDVQEQPSV